MKTNNRGHNQTGKRDHKMQNFTQRCRLISNDLYNYIYYLYKAYVYTYTLYHLNKTYILSFLFLSGVFSRRKTIYGDISGRMDAIDLRMGRGTEPIGANKD